MDRGLASVVGLSGTHGMSAFDLLVDCVKDATKERDELADALEQAQAENKSSRNTIKAMERNFGDMEVMAHTACDRAEQLEGELDTEVLLSVARHNKIEQLETAIRSAINRCGYAGNPEYVQETLEKALETAGDTLPEDDWRFAECDNCGWEVQMLASRVGNICTQCHLGALVEQSVPDTGQDDG